MVSLMASSSSSSASSASASASASSTNALLLRCVNEPNVRDALECTRRVARSVVDVALEYPNVSTTLALVAAQHAWHAYRARLPSRSIVLEFSLGTLDDYVDTEMPAAHAELFGAPPTFRSLIDALRAAADDERVAGLVCNVQLDATASVAKVEELRAALAAFRRGAANADDGNDNDNGNDDNARSGDNNERTPKFAVAYVDSLGDFFNGVQRLHLVSAFSHVFVSPAGDTSLCGLRLDTTFLARMFDKLEMRVELEGRREYKNIRDTFTRERLTDAHREAMQALGDALFAAVVDDVAAARSLDAERVRSLLTERGSVTAEQSVADGLVDATLYWPQVRERVDTLVADAAERAARRSHAPLWLARAMASTRTRWLYLSVYADAADVESRHSAPSPSWLEWLFTDNALLARLTLSADARRRRARRVVALVVCEGAIHSGESASPYAGGSPSCGADTATRALRAARAAPDVGCVLLRVNSPGGEIIASDLICDELARCRDAGLRVVVSMGDVAASGGYYISLPAHAIVANRSTITGSIGVVAGKLVSRQFWANKLGVTHDGVDVAGAPLATFFSELYSYDERAHAGGGGDAPPRALLERNLDRWYAGFKALVARWRHLDDEHVERVARGRVWVGAAALQHGLVDRLGTFDDALDECKRQMQFTDEQCRADVTVRVYPRPPTLATLLMPPRSSEECERRGGFAPAALSTPSLVSGIVAARVVSPSLAIAARNAAIGIVPASLRSAAQLLVGGTSRSGAMRTSTAGALALGETPTLL